MSEKPKLQRLGDRVPQVAPRLAMLQAGHAVDRIRGRRLQTIRHRWFSLHPLCVHCEQRGIVREATELDHVVALGLGGKDIDANRQGLCSDCHKAKTLQDIRAMGAGSSPMGGGAVASAGGRLERRSLDQWKPAATARADFFSAVEENTPND